MKLLKNIISFSLIFCLLFFGMVQTNLAHAADTAKTYYTIYKDSSKKDILFLKGEDVLEGDYYLSHDNKLYKIASVDDKQKTAVAEYVKDEELPIYNVKRKKVEETSEKASAAVNKKVGVYHTHNDECYFTPDGIDSIYGKGGIHDVGKEFTKQLNSLGIQTVYREDLHLPHNSGAYTRSQVTAVAILNEKVDGLFDLHRDSTKRSEYLTKVDGMQMSSIRMVVGASSKNYEENKKFAYSIKSYADAVYPGLIKDIYIGKGNYNQQLTTRAMLFEMGCENIEKSLVLKSTPYLAKVVDAVLYGSENASTQTMSDIETSSASQNGEKKESVFTGLATTSANDSGVNSNHTLYVVLGVLGAVAITFTLVMIFSKKARYKVGRFFSELFGGLFGKKKV